MSTQTVPDNVVHLRALWLRGITRYKALADDLRARIEKGEIEPGGKMPTIPALCKQHGVARKTAGHALQLLESEGVIRLFPGLGYYVRRQ